jgi:hypothetical protein
MTAGAIPLKTVVLVIVSVLVGMLAGMHGSRTGWLGPRLHSDAAVQVPIDVVGDGDVLLVSGGGGVAGTSVSNAEEELERLVHEVVTIVETKATSALVIETAVPVVATAAVLRALPMHDPFVSVDVARRTSTSRAYRTCAVVGNSGIVLGARLGIED